MNRSLPHAAKELDTRLQLFAALFFPAVALVLQSLLWDVFIAPLAWFLFYPAVFAASAYGGLVSGIGATVTSSALVAWAFLPQQGAWSVSEPRQWLSLASFVAMGVLFSIAHGRARSTRRALALAMVDAKRSRDQLVAVVESVQDGIAVADMAGNIFLVNEAQARINGFASRVDMQQNVTRFAELYELCEPDGRRVEPGQWPIARVLRGESITEWELVTRRKDIGREWLISFSGHPVFDEQGQQTLAVVITRDLTEKKLTQAALVKERLALDELREMNTWLPSPIPSSSSIRRG